MSCIIGISRVSSSFSLLLCCVNPTSAKKKKKKKKIVQQLKSKDPSAKIKDNVSPMQSLQSSQKLGF